MRPSTKQPATMAKKERPALSYCSVLLAGSMPMKISSGGSVNLNGAALRMRSM
jgi:hypothetical protein